MNTGAIKNLSKSNGHLDARKKLLIIDFNIFGPTPG